MELPLWVPEGRSEEQQITISTNVLNMEAYPWKWFTVEIFNEGPNTLYVAVNDTPDYAATKLDERESKTFGTDKKPTIQRLKMWVLTGTTAMAKITTLR